MKKVKIIEAQQLELSLATNVSTGVNKSFSTLPSIPNWLVTIIVAILVEKKCNHGVLLPVAKSIVKFKNAVSA